MSDMDGVSLPVSVRQGTTSLSSKESAAGGMEQIRRVAEDFEAVFLAQMLRPMFTDLTAEEPFGGGRAEEYWRDLEVDEMAKAMARSGGIGLADSLVSEMIAMQTAAGRTV